MSQLAFTGRNGHQGDTFWHEIKSIPEGAVKINKQFIAHSERSGSVHALYGNYDMYQHGSGVIVDCKEECVINHTLQQHLPKSMDKAVVLPKKDHRHSVIPAGTKMFVDIHRRADPLEGTFKRVID